VAHVRRALVVAGALEPPPPRVDELIREHGDVVALPALQDALEVHGAGDLQRPHAAVAQLCLQVELPHVILQPDDELPQERVAGCASRRRRRARLRRGAACVCSLISAAGWRRAPGSCTVRALRPRAPKSLGWASLRGRRSRLRRGAAFVCSLISAAGWRRAPGGWSPGARGCPRRRRGRWPGAARASRRARAARASPALAATSRPHRLTFSQGSFCRSKSW